MLVVIGNLLGSLNADFCTRMVIIIGVETVPFRIVAILLWSSQIEITQAIVKLVVIAVANYKALWRRPISGYPNEPMMPYGMSFSIQMKFRTSITINYGTFCLARLR